MRRSVASALDDVPLLGDLDRPTQGVLALVVVGLVARLAALGARVTHFDEGRVGWWILNFVDTGGFEYRYIIHGPLVQHVNRHLFPIIGANDFTLRLFVAVVGALLPLSALLFRDRLRDDETLAVAFFLALNPVLLYYSRFFRSTLLVAAFSFVAFGFLVRAYDRRSVRGIYYAAVFLALAFAAKENAVVYLIVWVGGTALLIDHALFRTGDGDRSGVDWALDRARHHRNRLDRYRASLPRYLGHGALALLLFLAISLYFYAPRSPNAEAVGLWQAVSNPTLVPDLIGRTVDDVVEGYGYWFGGSTDPGCHKDNLVDGYLCYLGRFLETVGNYALPLGLLSIFGFLAERWGRARPRNLVLFAGYWGFVSVLGYPLGTDIYGGWLTVNALVPLAIPAGVGLALVVRWGREADRDGDSIRVGVAAFVCLLVVGQMALAGATGVYLNPTADENEMVQYAQPADDFRPAMGVLEDRAADHEGTDVLFVGSTYVQETPRSGGIEPTCTSISDLLPVQWYVAAYGAEGDCERAVENATERLAEEDPLVVVASADDEERLAGSLEGYESETHRLRTYGSEAVFFYRTSDAAE